MIFVMVSKEVIVGVECRARVDWSSCVKLESLLQHDAAIILLRYIAYEVIDRKRHGGIYVG